MSCLERKHPELCLFWFPTLLPNVLLDCLPAATIADRSNVVAVCPEFPTPELGFDLRKLKAGFCCERLDPPDDLPSGVLWEELAEDMDVVLIEPDLVDIDCEAFLETFERLEDRVDHLRLKYCPPILDRELDVVVALRDVVVPPPDVLCDVGHGRALYLCAVCCSRIGILRALLRER